MKWSIVIRQILLRGNFLAGSADAVRDAYTDAPLGDTELTKNRAEYPFAAIADSIVQAMSLIVSAIGENRESNHRAAFLADTEPVRSGVVIPRLSSTGAPRFGLIRDVREHVADAPEGFVPRYLTHQPRAVIDIANKRHKRLRGNFFHFFTDDVRLWHTQDLAIAEIVAWDIEGERNRIYATNNTADCPLPNELLPALEFGALGFIYRDTFNAENAIANWQKFALELNKIAGKPVADLELPQKA